MNIALALVGLHHKQVGHMTGNVVLVARSITAKHLLQTESTVSIRKSSQRSKKHTLESWPGHDRSSDA